MCADNRIPDIRAIARADASRALREFLDELKGEKDEAVFGWGPVLKITVVKNRKQRQAGTTRYTRLALRFARSGAEYPANLTSVRASAAGRLRRFGAGSG